MLHGLSFELVRVISSIGKKTDWPGVATTLSVFFSQLLPVQSEKCILLLWWQWSTVFWNNLPKAQRQDHVFTDVRDERPEATEAVGMRIVFLPIVCNHIYDGQQGMGMNFNRQETIIPWIDVVPIFEDL